MNTIRQLYSRSDNPTPSLTKHEIEAACKKLKAGKAADIYGIHPDHILACYEDISEWLTSIFQEMMESCIPKHMKTEKKVPVPKKKKDDLIKDNYRGIGIPAILLKIFEIILIQKCSFLKQDGLQYGFTKGLCPQLATLVLTELICHAKVEKLTLVLATIDASKAFDIVDRDILMHELYQQDTPAYLWQTIDQLYTGNSCKVIWNGCTSKDVPINQGTGQGRSIAADMYKVYINPTIKKLRASEHGAKIGTINLAAPTCADDIALAAYGTENLQHLLSLVDSETSRNRSRVNNDKCEVSISKGVSEPPVYIGFEEIPYSKELTHIGNKRMTSNPGANIGERVNLARRAMYGFIPCGLHGENGLTPVATSNMLLVRILPILIYGLDAVILNKSHMNELDIFYNSMVRHLLGLRKSTATCSLYILSGLFPVKCELDCLTLGLFGFICRMDEQNPLKVLALRQLSLPESSTGWFTYAIDIAREYNLDTLLLANVIQSMPKNAYNAIIKTVIKGFWSDRLSEKAASMSSLCYMDINLITLGEPHYMWPTKANSRIRLAYKIRIKLLTGSYILQYNRAKYSKAEVSPLCILCDKQEVENVHHFMLACPSSEDIRVKHLNRLELLSKGSLSNRLYDAKVLLNLGPSRAVCCLSSQHHKPNCICCKMSDIVSELCLTLHNRHTQLLSNKEAERSKKRK